MVDRFDIAGRFALVTGASGLLGMEHSAALLEKGANVILTDIHAETLSVSKEKLIAQGFCAERIICKVMDVTSEQNILFVFDELKKENCFIEILVNNAAIDPKVGKESKLVESSRLENFPLEQWNSQVSVGLTGAFLCSKIFGSEMARKKRGVILNIASDLSVISPDQRLYRKEGLSSDLQPVKPVTYSAIKAGLIGLTKYLATYWADLGVRANALSPGGVYNGQGELFVSKLTNLIPMGRMATREEYRASIQFLCSDASLYMTGQNIVIDGGRTVL